MSTYACANFYPEVKSFTKNGDKFGWVKYLQMPFNLPNLPKFSPTTIFHYTVYYIIEKDVRARETTSKPCDLKE